MIRALLEKELRQHGVTFGFLFALLLVGLAAINGNRFLQEYAATGLDGMRLLLKFLVPLGSIMLGHVLIAAEFSNNTQLFLEGLPLPRWRLIAIKYMLGLAILLLGCFAALVVAFRAEIEMDALTVQYVLILSAKTAAWLFFVYSLFFSYAFLGRYRIPAAVGTFALLAHLQQRDVPISKFPAFQLVDARFAYEAHNFPSYDFWGTAGIGLILVLCAFWVGLARDATLASRLAKKMSGSEKAIFTFLTIVGVLSFGYVAQSARQSEPVKMPGAIELERGLIRVAASAAVNMPTSSEQAAIQRIVDRVATELEEVAQYLGCKTMPPVFIVHRRDFNAGQFENGGLKREQGLMIRVNLAPEVFREREFLETLIREFLTLKSSGRATMETNAWVLHGFPRWWIHRRLQPDFQPESLSPEDLKKLATEKIELSEQSLKEWFSLSQKLGPEQSKVLAGTGLTQLEHRYGMTACRAFLGAMLAQDVPHDVRGWLQDVVNPLSRRFRAATGVSLDTFARSWNESIQGLKTHQPPTE